VGTDVDLMTTYVGGSSAAVEALLADDQLEVLAVPDNQGITWEADTINPLREAAGEGLPAGSRLGWSRAKRARKRLKRRGRGGQASSTTSSCCRPRNAATGAVKQSLWHRHRAKPPDR
jgi:hypothetical protein